MVFGTLLQPLDKSCNSWNFFSNFLGCRAFPQCLELAVLGPHGSDVVLVMRHFVFEGAELAVQSFHGSVHVLGLLHLISIDPEHLIVHPRLRLHDAHDLWCRIELDFHEVA